jgi:hypothetical protein
VGVGFVFGAVWLRFGAVFCNERVILHTSLLTVIPS